MTKDAVADDWAEESGDCGGRAIRVKNRAVDDLDLELSVRKRSRITTTDPANNWVRLSQDKPASNVIDKSGGNPKFNKITWNGSTFYTTMTLEEYVSYTKELDDFLRHPPGWDDPNSYKEDAAELCRECFPVIQKKFPEMADWELVEPMDSTPFLTWSSFAHVNFKAKPKGTGDSSITVYFAEYDKCQKEVLCLSKIDADLGTGSDPQCIHCHPPDALPYGGHVYHPANST